VRTEEGRHEGGRREERRTSPLRMVYHKSPLQESGRKGGREGGRKGRTESKFVVSIPAHMTTMGPRKRLAVARRGRKMAGVVQPKLRREGG